MPPSAEWKETFCRLMGPDPWSIDQAKYENEVFEISGWALAPGGRHEEVSFSLNDRKFDVVNYPLPSGYLAKTFFYRPDAELSGFLCRSHVKMDEAFPNGCATLKCTDLHSGMPLADRGTLYFPDSRLGPPLPALDRQRRVAGVGDDGAFLLAGGSLFKNFEHALRSTYGKGYEGFESLLDWGCGCGRLTRYFWDRPKLKVTGGDIDQDNLAWCAQHLTFATFEMFPLHPPTKLHNDSFDLIIGVSVFTHLKESDQLDWLAELYRLARPGAVLLMTTHGSAAASRSEMQLAEVRGWERAGMIYHSGDDNLKGYIEDDDYYGTSYMTTQYVRDQWSKFFTIDAILPGYVGHHQDLVVMRKV